MIDRLAALFSVAGLMMVMLAATPAMASPIGWWPVGHHVEISNDEAPAVQANFVYQASLTFEDAVELADVTFVDPNGDALAAQLDVVRLHRQPIHPSAQQETSNHHRAVFYWTPEKELEVGKTYRMLFEQEWGPGYDVEFEIVEQTGAVAGVPTVVDAQFHTDDTAHESACCGCEDSSRNSCDDCFVTVRRRHGIISGPVRLHVDATNPTQWILHVVDEHGDPLHSVWLNRFVNYEDFELERVLFDEPESECLQVAIEGVHDDSWRVGQPSCVESLEGFEYGELVDVRDEPDDPTDPCDGELAGDDVGSDVDAGGGDHVAGIDAGANTQPDTGGTSPVSDDVEQAHGNGGCSTAGATPTTPLAGLVFLVLLVARRSHPESRNRRTFFGVHRPLPGVGE